MVSVDRLTAVDERLMSLNCGCGLWVLALVSAHMYCTRTVPQMLPVQTAGDVQSAAWVGMVQVVLHAFVTLQLKLPGHAPLVEVWHTPPPLHRRGWTRVLPVVQIGSTQVVPLAKFLQLPEPSQVPSKPQVDWSAFGHWGGVVSA